MLMKLLILFIFLCTDFKITALANYHGLGLTGLGKQKVLAKICSKLSAYIDIQSVNKGLDVREQRKIGKKGI